MGPRPFPPQLVGLSLERREGRGSRLPNPVHRRAYKYKRYKKTNTENNSLMETKLLENGLVFKAPEES